MVDAELARACETAGDAAKKALEWISDPKNDGLIGQERVFLERTIRSQAYRARRFAASLERPMCVGVFGPSQAGKSYLVSVLARKGDTLTALFDDPERPEVDFIRDINPYGEKEATGLVTRFSIEKPATPKDFPVALRLLTQTDVLKIICNSYFFDGDLEAETPVSAKEIDAHISGLSSSCRPAMWTCFGKRTSGTSKNISCASCAARRRKSSRRSGNASRALAPWLAIKERAELFSVLWGRHKELTDLFVALLECLDKLGFAENAYCPLAALIPAAKGILNVETLAGLGAEGTERSRSSRTARPPRLAVRSWRLSRRNCA